MPKVLLALAAAATFALMIAAGALGHPPGPGTHLHCVLTPSGKLHSVARGVTMHAPHDPAFHNFHGHPHAGPGLPFFASADFSVPYTCPPTP